jgi:hypothetical protein
MIMMFTKSVFQVSMFSSFNLGSSRMFLAKKCLLIEP